MVDACRKYEWIVKGGEEVRIDQRIEQLFDVMNGLMQRQPGAAAHSLQVPSPYHCPSVSFCNIRIMHSGSDQYISHALVNSVMCQALA